LRFPRCTPAKRIAVSLVDSPRSIQHVAIVFALILGFCLTFTSQTLSPPGGLDNLIGTWKLNLAKSTFEAGPPPYKRSTCKIEALRDGLIGSLKVSYDNVGVRGGVAHVEWVGKLDGKDYPMEGVDEVVTNAYTRVDERTYEVVVKVDGVKAANARIVISPDGKTLTSVTSTRNAQGQTLKTTAVYNRQ
jgi:hypothetical protein